MRIIKIKYCDECPFAKISNDFDGQDFCEHTGNQLPENYDRDGFIIIPKWCPLENSHKEKINGIHIYQGLCPDVCNGPYSRDTNCPVCQALIEIESRKKNLID